MALVDTVGLGVVLVIPAAALTGRLRPGRPPREEASGSGDVYALRPEILVELTGLEPVTPCLQSSTGAVRQRP